MQCLKDQQDQTIVKDIIFEVYLIGDAFYLNTIVKKNKDDAMKEPIHF